MRQVGKLFIMVGKRNKNKVAHLLGELGELRQQETKDQGSRGLKWKGMFNRTYQGHCLFC